MWKDVYIAKKGYSIESYYLFLLRVVKHINVNASEFLENRGDILIDWFLIQMFINRFRAGNLYKKSIHYVP